MRGGIASFFNEKVDLFNERLLSYDLAAVEWPFAIGIQLKNRHSEFRGRSPIFIGRRQRFDPQRSQLRFAFVHAKRMMQ
jgi:hypothetical protein